jgi:hypothetical protein
VQVKEHQVPLPGGVRGGLIQVKKVKGTVQRYNKNKDKLT